jgi:DHA3 family macrolide efflux protein-like MFS transporter
MDTAVPVNPTHWKKRFFTIWIGQAFSLFGSRLVQFSLIWWLTMSTGSATVLATATLFGLLPEVLLGPFIGPLVDRWNRRRVMMLADGAVALVTVGLMVLFWTGEVAVWHIYAAMTLRALVGAFHWPSMQASTSLMVPGDQLARVAGLNQALNGVLSIASPPLAALLLGWLPMHVVLSVDVVTAVLAVAPLFFLPIPQPASNPTAAGMSSVAIFWRDFRDGLRYVWSWPGLVAILFMAMVINFLFNPAFSLMPLLVTEHFGGGIFELSLMESLSGVGVIVGGVTLSVWGGFKRKIFTTLTGLVGMGIGTILIGLSPSNFYILGLTGMVLLGLMNPITNGPLFAVLQSTVAPDMQGRVLTLIMSTCTAMSPLSMLIAGPVADHFGIPFWYLAAGVVCLMMGIGAFFVPRIVHLEEQVRPSSEAVELAASGTHLPAAAD